MDKALINLKDVTFIIPVRIESEDRKRNAITTIAYLLNNFDTKVIVKEVDVVSNFSEKVMPELKKICGKNINNLNHIFEDSGGDSVFYRMQILNEMLATVGTEIVVNYDVDILLEKDTILKAVELIRYAEYDLIYPYGVPNFQYMVSVSESECYEFIENEYNFEFLRNKSQQEATFAGHVQFFRTSSYIKGGMENENFKGSSPEDIERLYRFEKLGYKVGRIDDGWVYHIEHERFQNSYPISISGNPYFKDNINLWEHIQRLSDEEIRTYYSSQEYLKKYEKEWNLINFSYGKKFTSFQNILKNICENEFKIRTFMYKENDLIKTDFYQNNSSILNKNNKYGSCAWKPYFILKAMESLNENDLLMYIDSLDMFVPDIFKEVNVIMNNNSMAFVLGGSENKNNTKRDCFVFMNCDNKKYWDAIQLEAGVSFWKVCDESKKFLQEWLTWCMDERVNGEKTNFSGSPELDSFQIFSGKDQSILTNMVVRDNLCVLPQSIRDHLECNYNSWIENYLTNKNQSDRKIEKFLISKIDNFSQFNSLKIKHSLVLTIHNKDYLIENVLDGIKNNTTGIYELIIVLDGCNDNTESIVNSYIEKTGLSIITKVIHTPDVFETKANNEGIKEASGKYVVIIQDDMVIKEHGWNRRLQKPLENFDDVFAVTARTAHNWEFNPNTKQLLSEEFFENEYSDILLGCESADRTNIPRDTFAVRGSVNRGPLMMNLEDFRSLDGFDENFAPLDMDDHDLMFRAKRDLNKVVGCYWIDYESDPIWGGTRVDGSPARWFLQANQKNVKMFYNNHKDLFETYRVIEDRKIS